jgi:hypothetical protein
MSKQTVVLGSDEHLKPSVGSDRERDNKFYQLLAGGARLR